MAENLLIDKQAGKQEKYEQLLPQIKALIEGESNVIANMANTASALKEAFGWLWVGFYIVDGQREDELVLGPFQGPIACTRIKIGKGVCGTAWEKAETVIVDDVDQFPGHIACSSLSRSEIVVPMKDSDGNVWGVLDVDSEELAAFDEVDALWLGKVCSSIH